MATVTRTGVKWVKVSKTDALGNSYNNSWRLNDSFRLNYSTPGNTQYIVNSVTEYPTYWLLGLDYANTTSSLQGAKNYKVVADNNNSYNFSTGISSSITDYSKTTDASSLFNAAAGLFQSLNQPNIPIIYSASVTFYPNDPTKAYPMVSFVENPGEVTNTVISKRSVLNPGTYPYTLRISGSFIPNPSSNYGLIVGQDYNASALPVDIQVGDITFTITQSVAPASNTLTILDPFITQPFEGTDCDVTYGWIQSYPHSQYFMDIDYSNSATIPVNQTALISGTATPAVVQDYYYNSNRQIIPRYVGSKLTGQQLNIYTPGDNSYGKEPVINTGQAYFNYFNYIYGVTPEVNGVIAADVKYTIDQLGGIYAPGSDLETVRTLKQNYPEGSVAAIRLIGETNQAMSTNLNKEFTVYRAGAKVKPIIYSQTGSLGYTSSITFNPSTTSPKSYRAWIEWNSSTTVNSNTSLTVPLDTEVYDDANYYNPSTYQYTFGTSPLARITLESRLEVLNASSVDTTVQLIIYKNNTGILFSPQTVLPANSTGYTELTAKSSQTGIEFANGDVIKTVLVNYGPSSITAQSGYFIVGQVGFSGSATATAPYFTTDSTGISNVLTCSLDLYKKLGNPQADITSSGFNPINDNFTFQVGDQLRFQNDETKVHTITAIGNPTTLYGPTLTITPSLISGSNLDFFLLRRFEDSPNTVLLVGGKPSGATSGGTLTPKYLSEALQKGTSNIIADLSSKNLI